VRALGRAAAVAPVVVGLLLAAAIGTGCARQPPAARLVIDGTRHDFGTLWVGEVKRHSFRVENRGTLPLEFGAVRSTCGCLLHELSARRVEPGQAATLTVELHADRGAGPLEKQLSVETNDFERRTLVLDLSARLETLYKLEPPLLDVGDLVLGEPRDLTVKLTVTDGSELALGPAHCPETSFTASARATSRDSAEIALRFEGDAWPGRRLFRVGLPTGHPRVPEATIPVQAVVLPRLSIEPGDRVDFGSVARARGGEVALRVVARGKAALAAPTAVVELGGTAKPDDPSAAPRVAARIEPIVEGRQWRLVVAVEPGSPGGALIGRVLLRHAAPHEPPHTLTLTGRIVD